VKEKETEMPIAQVNGVGIHYEVAGTGFPLVWAHEWGGCSASWDPQVRCLARYYRVITYDARGYPPSEVPVTDEAYSQEIAVADLYGLLLHLGISEAYVGGLSMGGSTSLNFAISHPDVVKALIIASSGAGSSNREQFEADMLGMIHKLESTGVEAVADTFARGPTRVQLLRKDPKAWREFYNNFVQRSPIGLAQCVQQVILRRKTVYELEAQLRQVEAPTLIMVGDEDEPCIEPGIFMKRSIPHSGMTFFPQSGHLLNLEEPELFNRSVLDFLSLAEKGKWPGD
jgi:pimeloyl-ACP methyl ester carboxylesterase